MLNKIHEYLGSKKNIWAASTLKSEHARLTKLAPYVTGDAAALWKVLCEKHKPYARVTAWIRVTQFWAEMFPGPNPYDEFKRQNPKLFNQSYIRKIPALSFKEALDGINAIEDEAVKIKCLQLLKSGMRWQESSTLKDGRVVGKGNKERRVFNAVDACAPYSAVRGALAKLGLTPHGLRKLYAMELVRRGANPFQLKKAMGWSNLNTAQSYIEAHDSELIKLTEGM